MKKLTKILSMALVLMLSLTVMIGCGGPKLTPDQSAKIVLDILLKGDNSQIAEIGMSQDEFDQVRKAMDDQMEALITQLGRASISEDNKKVLQESFFESIKKVEYTTKLVSEEKNTATVELSIKPVDMTALATQLMDEAKNYATANPTATQKEASEFVIQKFAELLKSAPLKSEETKIIINLSSDGKVWMPNKADFTKIGNSLFAQ